MSARNGLKTTWKTLRLKLSDWLLLLCSETRLLEWICFRNITRRSWFDKGIPLFGKSKFFNEVKMFSFLGLFIVECIS